MPGRKLTASATLALTCAAFLTAVPAVATAASINGASLPPVSPVVDAGGNTWTVTNGTVYENGIAAGCTTNVIRLVYLNNVIYQENNSKNWWSWNGAGWVAVSSPEIASASNTSIPTATLIIDASGNNWAVSSGGVYENGAPAGVTANVIELLYLNNVIYQENNANAWWSWNGTDWVSTSNPTGGGTGAFRVSSGQILGPSGSAYVARGINVADWAATGNGAPGDVGNGTANGTFLLQLMPHVNFVRVNCQNTNSAGLSVDPGSGYNDDPANFDTFVNNLTSKGIVVEIEDHAGGNNIPTGSNYTAEMQWYKDMATHYRNNPYVWFGTMNEPWANPTNTVLQQELDIYNAIRSTGNQAPVLIEISNPPDGNGTQWSNHDSFFSSMTNTVWDVHVYDLSGGSQSAVNTSMASVISQINNAGDPSADGTMPIIVGEYGSSLNGSTVDATGPDTVIAVQASGIGSAAWTWKGGSADIIQVNGVLTSFGNELNTFFDAGVAPSSWNDTDGS